MEDFIRELGKNYLDPEDMEGGSLHQSPAVTAPSSEGAVGSGELFGFRLLEPVALFI